MVNYTWDMFLVGAVSSCGINVDNSGYYCFGMALLDSAAYILIFYYYVKLEVKRTDPTVIPFRLLSMGLYISFFKISLLMHLVYGSIGIEAGIAVIILVLLQFMILPRYVFFWSESIINNLIKNNEGG